ncbi:amino acid-binding protein [Arthrobacter sp. PsM3]|uniref:amino acid-binding protein n=1 Tax=Arthrobacter sp. PsM3 TaxID=3030531 RepID=UPI00263BC9FE|nr:amino acid-binding protein [Arthrobacter sp. PsM3]MDN4643336.1 amino acid-binding protein [Arthrobacter sp. PsM3]
MTTQNRDTAHALACDSCGQLPHPAKARLTLANVAAMLPIELVVHAAVVDTEMPYLLKVLVLTLTATTLVIWVAEPSVRHALRGWLHAPALRHRRRLHESGALWRVRTLIDDDPEGQEKLARGVSGVGADILVRRRHHVPGGVLDELVVAAPDDVTDTDLLAAAGEGGGRDVRAWPATALAVADGQTKALALALRVAEDPDELQLAVAELLDAEPVANPDRPINPVEDCTRAHDGGPDCDGTLLKIPSPLHEPLRFSRPHAPFTPAESARAHRLAELAELTELSRKHTIRALQ